MLIPALKYWGHRCVHQGDIRLVMTILVRNESDIIEENIRFHAAQGVDAFVVMDNHSDDGTREILSELQSDYDLTIIDQTEQNYQQAKWMTELAFIAANQIGADLVISNDADEFWLATPGTQLKDHLCPNDSVVTVKRHNMVLTESVLQQNYHYSQAKFMVKNPIDYADQTQGYEAMSMLLIKISPKTIINPYGLIRLKGGNHRAKHGWKWANARTESGIRVFHYPIRSYERFEQNIINRKRLLETTNAGMGPHYRRWVQLYNNGKLEEEFSQFILTPQDLKTTNRLSITAPAEDMHQTLKHIYSSKNSISQNSLGTLAVTAR